MKPRTRRALLAGALGASVATVATAIGRPDAARAADPNDVVLGATNTTAFTTVISNTSGGTGISGLAALTGPGVRGHSPSGVGLLGQSDEYSGVYGFVAGGAGARGVTGDAYGDGTGVVGTSSTLGVAPGTPPKTGVFGFAAQDASARGVVGQSTAGQGVRGLATSGIGVRGFATTGPAGSFESTSGYALQTSGRLSFGKASGTATIAAGTKSVLVTPGADVAVATFVVATLQGNPGGTTTVQRVATDPTNNRFTIHLTANTTQAVKVAWLVMG